MHLSVINTFQLQYPKTIDDLGYADERVKSRLFHILEREASIAPTTHLTWSL